MTAAIRHISVALPERALPNDELAQENPAWDMVSVAERAGVVSRRISAADETALDLSVRACDALAEESDIALASVDAIVYCTQSPDYVMPGNAHLLHRELGLADRVLAFDYNLACSGYVYGLAFADSFIASGLASVISGAEHGGARIVASDLRSHGRDFEKFYIPAGGMRRPRSEETKRESIDRNGNVRSLENIHMDGFGVWAWVNSVVPGHVRGFLEQQSLTPDDVDLYVFHQASKMTLDSVAKALALPPEKLYVRMEHVGNLVSASIPVAVRMALDEGAIRPGNRVLLCGFGVGLSYGSVLVEF